MATSSIRVLLVDDYEPFRRFVASVLQQRPELQIVAEVSDGLDAVQKTKELEPDLVLLDIGLPNLNGIEVANRIRTSAPQTDILFVSLETSTEIVHAALATGARGYVAKTDARSELMIAVKAVLAGGRYISKRLTGHDFRQSQRPTAMFRDEYDAPSTPNLSDAIESNYGHEAVFYSDEGRLLDNISHFVGAALRAGDAAIVIAAESHRNRLLPMLYDRDLAIGSAIEHGRYIALDAAEALSRFMHKRMPDPFRFLTLMSELIAAATAGKKGKQARVAIFGECVHLLCTQGNAEAAIQVEKLGNEVAKQYDVDILCGYALDSFQGAIGSHVFEEICAQHSLVYSR